MSSTISHSAPQTKPGNRFSVKATSSPTQTGETASSAPVEAGARPPYADVRNRSRQRDRRSAATLSEDAEERRLLPPSRDKGQPRSSPGQLSVLRSRHFGPGPRM